jgi:hypothetical protein
MRVSDLISGSISTLQVERIEDEPFTGYLQNTMELSMAYDEHSDEIILSIGDVPFSIEAINSKEKAKLNKIVKRGFPKIVWLVSKNLIKRKAKQITIQIHEFPNQWSLPDNVEIGIDEKIIESYKSNFLKRTDTKNTVIENIKGQFLIQKYSKKTNPRLQISVTIDSIYSKTKSFTMIGKNAWAVVVRNEDNNYLIKQITKGRRQRDNSQMEIILLEAQIEFVDATIMGKHAAEYKLQIDELIQKNESWLAIWKEYNELEYKRNLKNAYEIGWFHYESIRREGYSWIFSIDKNLDLEKNNFLRFNDIQLEASRNVPSDIKNFSISDSGLDDSEKQNNFSSKNVSGRVSLFNPVMSEIGIQIDEDDDDLEPPVQGYLYLSIKGDKVKYERRNEAAQSIESHSCPMPQLGMILENREVITARYGTHPYLTPVVKKVFNHNQTEKQAKAIDVAINTPDITLIQGPPGTGKTKVISAIVKRLQEISDKNQAPAGQILVCSEQHDAVENVASGSDVLGLPAVKIGKKRGEHDLTIIDPVENWRLKQIRTIKNYLKDAGQIPVDVIKKKVTQLTSAYYKAPMQKQQTSTMLNNITDLAHEYLPADLIDRIKARMEQLGRSLKSGINDIDNELALKAVRSIRTTKNAFLDDGPSMAYKAKTRVEAIGLLKPEEKKILDVAFDWKMNQPMNFLKDLKKIKDSLIDRILSDEQPDMSPTVDSSTTEILKDVINELNKKLNSYLGGPEKVIYDYLNDLENDPNGVRNTIRDYTVVLASTVQQSKSNKMALAKTGEITRDYDFNTIIVDEAARANPLDLFIPLSVASRRIILVGDHRQLPHMLEPDIEKEVKESITIKDEFQDALNKSLFERLFNELKDREEKDGITRTVTLDKQFRMHPELGEFVSRNFYESHGDPIIESGRSEDDFFHDLPGYEGKILCWNNISEGRESKTKSKTRNSEAKAIAKELKRIVHHNENMTFGVITFYKKQVGLIWKALKDEGLAELIDEDYQVIKSLKQTEKNGEFTEKLRIGTVDAFQGLEFDCVMLSVVRSNNIKLTESEETWKSKYGFLMLENRSCVAMSRQQRLLIVFGDKEMFKNEYAQQAVPALANLVEICK